MTETQVQNKLQTLDHEEKNRLLDRALTKGSSSTAFFVERFVRDGNTKAMPKRVSAEVASLLN